MSNSNALGIISWNADGIRNKIHELLDLAVSDLFVDIIALCETKLTKNTSLHTPGFTCYRIDKNQNGRWQGVALLIKKIYLPFYCYRTKYDKFRSHSDKNRRIRQ